MKTAIRILAGLILLTTPIHAQSCEETAHLGDSYVVCASTPSGEIGLWHSDKTGTPYGDFFTLSRSLEEDGSELLFAMNGGMFHEDRRPVGYFVNGGEVESALITREGPGNFGLLPNGVFCVAGGKAAVFETLRFEAEAPECQIATQSGPMLVIDGQLHPKFMPDSSSRKIRNGVGVGPDGTTYFAISNQPVRFHDFATLFRDLLGVPNALFLEGSVSRLYAPSLGRNDGGAMMGPIIGMSAPVQ